MNQRSVSGKHQSILIGPAVCVSTHHSSMFFSSINWNSWSMQNVPSQQSDPYMRDPKARKPEPEDFESNPWRDNHGNLLLGFTAIVCLVGASILACQQTRFAPPRFPTLNQGGDYADLDPSQLAASGKPGVRPVPLKIYGAASDEGVMKIAVYTQAEGFNNPAMAFEVDTWRIVDGVCAGLWEMPIELERFAIAAFHDVNKNGELDRNPLGIPSERYGFSNNARGLTGPPSFEEAAITLEADKPIEISIR
jgi:uncharacterized protein (DUF2141 family)